MPRHRIATNHNASSMERNHVGNHAVAADRRQHDFAAVVRHDSISTEPMHLVNRAVIHRLDPILFDAHNFGSKALFVDGALTITNSLDKTRFLTFIVKTNPFSEANNIVL